MEVGRSQQRHIACRVERCFHVERTHGIQHLVGWTRADEAAQVRLEPNPHGRIGEAVLGQQVEQIEATAEGVGANVPSLIMLAHTGHNHTHMEEKNT